MCAHPVSLSVSSSLCHPCAPLAAAAAVAVRAMHTGTVCCEDKITIKFNANKSGTHLYIKCRVSLISDDDFKPARKRVFSMSFVFKSVVMQACEALITHTVLCLMLSCIYKLRSIHFSHPFNPFIGGHPGRYLCTETWTATQRNWISVILFVNIVGAA